MTKSKSAGLSSLRLLAEVDHGLDAFVVQQICAVFAHHNAVGMAVLYGSRAKGCYRKGSDIDLTLMASSAQLLDLETISQIEEALDDLMLPYSFDLSVFAEIENQNLVDHIQRVGVIFYQR